MIYTLSKIYSAEQAAKLLNISKMTMTRRIKNGDIHAQNIGSEARPRYAIHECEILAYKLYLFNELMSDERREGMNLENIVQDYLER